MDEKIPQGLVYSRARSRHTGKSSSLQDSNNRSSMGNNNVCRNPSRLFSSSVDHQKSLPSKINQVLSQKRIVAGRINRTVSNNVPKDTPKLSESSGSKFTPKTARVREALSFLEDTNSANHQHSVEDREQIRREPGCRSLYAPTFSFTQRLIASRDTKKATKNCSQGAKTGTNICDSKRKSSSISNVIPSVSSQSVSSPTRRENTTITRNFSTSSKRKLSGSPNTRLTNSSTPNSTRIINKSIPDHQWMIKSLKHSDTGTTARHHARASSSRSLGSELDYSPGSRNFRIRGSSGRLTSSTERGKMLLYDHSSNTDAYMHNNTEGVEEEEPERNESEQDKHMLEYESIMFFHDQHDEMRMDIDDMSYEELLDLSEQIGSVSTGLTDEAMEKCLQRSSFKLSISSSGNSELIEDGNVCSICQEECDDGEEIGTLACEHWYHPVCIEYWLRQKNWCPICKAPASVDNIN